MAKRKENQPIIRKGVYYFPHWDDAFIYATEHGIKSDRIISYEPGWAIQLGKSGPYLGPEVSHIR